MISQEREELKRHGGRVPTCAELDSRSTCFFFKGWTKANFQFFLEVDWKLFWMILMISTDGKHWILSCVTTRNVAWQFR
jgi:hypothetical protein